MYKARTLRRMNPTARRLAKIYNEMEKELKRLKKDIDNIHDLEFQLQASQNEINAMRDKLNWKEQSAIAKVTTERIF